MLMLVATSVASAQARRPATSTAKVWEIGADAGLQFGLDDPNTTTLQIPFQSIRAGIHVSPVLSIEPFFGLNYLKVEGLDDAISTYEFGVGALYHFSESRTRSQIFVRPALSVVGASVGGESDSEVGAGVGLGIKWPKLGGRMAWRGEANISFINDNTVLGALFGISFFTR
jgi:hypothetical protein